MFRTRPLINRFKSTTINLDLFNPINNFACKNIEFLSSLEIKIINPKIVSSYSIFRTHIFNARINFDKNNMSVSKEFKNNDLSLLFADINKFVNEEIKL